MFRPSNARPTNPERIRSIDAANVEEMHDEELQAHRKEIAGLTKHLQTKMAETATTKATDFDVDAIRQYVQKILDDGFQLLPTALGSVPEFIPAQRLKHFQKLIRETVESSSFGTKQFKIHALRFQRSAIEQSKTLHDLRQNVERIIGPLQIYREMQKLKATVREADKLAMADINILLEEIEDKDAVIEERERVLSEVKALYEPSFDKAVLLQQIEDFKAAHGCSDKEAGNFFGKSDRTIRRLRQQYGSMLKAKPGYASSPLELSKQLPSLAHEQLEQTDEEFFADFEPLA